MTPSVPWGRPATMLHRATVSLLMLHCAGCYSFYEVKLPSLLDPDVGRLVDGLTLVLGPSANGEHVAIMVSTLSGASTIFPGCDGEQLDGWLAGATTLAVMQFPPDSVMETTGNTLGAADVCATRIASCAERSPCGSHAGIFTRSKDRACSKYAGGLPSPSFKYAEWSTETGWLSATGTAADTIRCSVALEIIPTN